MGGAGLGTNEALFRGRADCQDMAWRTSPEGKAKNQVLYLASHPLALPDPLGPTRFLALS
jgi:hypothetical protein